jgi:DNA-binding GntR family transcriptional regulator
LKIKAIDVSQTASVSTIIFDALREAIISGELEDGEPLRQEEIGKLFNTSRIPVREAITRLEQHGLVKTVRYKGAVVSGISDTDVDEIFDLRVLLEGAIVRHAVPLMTPSILQTAQKFCEDFASSSQPGTWGRLNRDFHCALYEAADRPNHMAIINSIMDRIDRVIRAHLALTDGMEIAIREHERILKACMDGDAELAGQLTEQHVQDAKEILLDFLRTQRETKTKF